MFANPLTVLYAIVPFAGATSVKMDYLPTGFARVDPILSQDCLSDHVHTFYGPQSGVEPRRLDSSDELEFHSRLVKTPVEENTGNVEENKSSESVSFDFSPRASNFSDRAASVLASDGVQVRSILQYLHASRHGSVECILCLANGGD